VLEKHNSIFWLILWVLVVLKEGNFFLNCEGWNAANLQWEKSIKYATLLIDLLIRL
jgi:hypothetical protein